MVFVAESPREFEGLLGVVLAAAGQLAIVAVVATTISNAAQAPSEITSDYRLGAILFVVMALLGGGLANALVWIAADQLARRAR